jgi:signal recognition particle GTPase
VVDEEVVNQMLQDISRALIESDVNIRVVSQLRKSIKEKVNLEDAPAGEPLLPSSWARVARVLMALPRWLVQASTGESWSRRL